MDWKRPMTGTATVDFTFKPEGDQTVVTPGDMRQKQFPGQVVSLFMIATKCAAAI
jgi:hypothetical protein